MDEPTKIALDILLSVYTGHETYTSIRTDTRFSPTTLKKYLPDLEQDGLIKTDSVDWRRGKSKRCSMTETGTTWLINTSLLDSLKVFSTILNEFKKPKIRSIYRKMRDEKHSQTLALLKTHIQECAKKGVDPFAEMEQLTEWGYRKRFKIIDMDQLLLEALKKLFVVVWYFWSNSERPEAIEDMINTHYVIFGKEMRPFLVYRPGSRPELDLQLQKLQEEFLTENRRAAGWYG